MSKNIVIFSDGTGQAGGLRPDQNLSNIYKLFRAARVGPESPIDPKEQVSFYDAGLGTDNDGGSIPFRSIQWFRKMWSSATGTGISRNIADCYEAILKHHEPGDRVFLFGFSRGAYTARCVGGVMALCGVPKRAADGGPLPRLGKDLRKIADEAVQQVYEHGSGSNSPERRAERLEKARRFRKKYRSEDASGASNAVPYFIGVFDTVASLGASGVRRLGMFLLLSSFVIGITAIVTGVLNAMLPLLSFWLTFCVLCLGIGAVMIAGHIKGSLKTIRNFPNKGSFKWHFAAWRFRFYDNTLNPMVRYARHAIAIDEDRKDFQRVPWGSPKDWPLRTGEPEWLRQIWFAGNHSDIGGSYPEDESRLSDVSLEWMLDEATSLPHPLLVDRSRLHLYPDPTGMQHCEIESMRNSYPSWIPHQLRPVWARQSRDLNAQAPLHPSVAVRIRHKDGVLHHGRSAHYRPTNLTAHEIAVGIFREQGLEG